MNNLSRISQACYIPLNNNQPGIVGLFINDPEHAKIMSELAQHLLQGEHDLPIEFRELVAAYVSKVNNCNFCYNSHKEIALASNTGLDNTVIMAEVLLENDFTNLDNKYQALLQIAGVLATNVQGVTKELVDQARDFGAKDSEILRTVQIASAFCMYNRYVDGLGTIPGTAEYYKEAGKNIAENGYMIKLEETA